MITLHSVAADLRRKSDSQPIAAVVAPQTYEPACMISWREACEGVDEQAAYAFRRRGGKTGWPPGLLQDDCSELSRWFASRMDARHVVRSIDYQPKEAQ